MLKCLAQVVNNVFGVFNSDGKSYEEFVALYYPNNCVTSQKPTEMKKKILLYVLAVSLLTICDQLFQIAEGIDGPRPLTEAEVVR